jgi:dolichol-phosphate mannosyltransferase
MLFILLPIYNEEENLQTLIQELHNEFGGTEVRIIAINDGSTDRSLEILKSQLRETDIVYSYAINMNIGVGFSEGIREFLIHSTDGDVLIIIESDQTSDIQLVRNLYKTIRENKMDAVIASRYCDGGGYYRCPIYRRILSYGANRFMKLVFPIENVSEYSLFCRAYSWDIMTQMSEHFGVHGIVQSSSFFANAELLIKMSFLTDQFTEIPAVYDYGKKRGASKIRYLLTFFEYFTMIRRLRKIRRKLRASAAFSES